MAGPRIIPEYREKFFLPVEVDKDAPGREAWISKILNLPPILARGGNDHLIEFDPDVDPPTVIWKKELVDQLDLANLLMLYNMLSNKLELQQRKF